MSREVPYWKQLPDYARKQLAATAKRNSGGPNGSDWPYGEIWFDKETDVNRLTVLNLYVKLSGMSLWQYVSEGLRTTGHGCLEFRSNDVLALKRELTNRRDFTEPEDSLVVWSCREKVSTGALHFKHFTPWPTDYVQAHIDKTGLGFGGKWSPLVLGPLVMGLPHLADDCRHGWKDVFGIRDILLRQGWDPLPLLGVGAWHCGARDCQSHSRPEHRCQAGVWFCGRRQPPCPGHGKPGDRCSAGLTWYCGERQCPTHGQPQHRCPTGVWYCGRMCPPCPGHRNRDDRCERGAALRFASRAG
jgi:hypothetical protein